MNTEQRTYYITEHFQLGPKAIEMGHTELSADTLSSIILSTELGKSSLYRHPVWGSPTLEEHVGRCFGKPWNDDKLKNRTQEVLAKYLAEIGLLEAVK